MFDLAYQKLAHLGNSGSMNYPFVLQLNWLVWRKDGPWPDPTLTYFWPAVNKRQPCLWPDPKRFFCLKGKKLKIWDFWGKFSKPKLRMVDPTRATKNWSDPAQKIWPITSLTNWIFKHNKFLLHMNNPLCFLFWQSSEPHLIVFLD